MTPRTVLTSALLLALTVPGAAFADPVDDIAALIKESSTSGDPAMAFMTGFEGMSDFSVGPDQLREAMRRANMGGGGAMDGILGNTKSIAKSGNKVTINVDGSHNEIYTGPNQQQVRFFTLDGDKLSFRTPEQASSVRPGKRVVTTTTFERER